MNILIIRPGAIGDALLTFPVLQALKKHYTNASITLVSNASILPLALTFGVADAVSDYQDVQWSKLFSSTGIQNPSMRNLLQQMDRAICWLRDSDHVVERNLQQAGIKHIIIAPGRPPEGERVHVVEYLARTVGLSDLRAQFMTPPQIGGQGEYSQPHRKGGVSTAPTRHIAIHPGSGSTQKCWPAHHFAAVIERLWQRNIPILLLSGPADAECTDALLSQLAPSAKPEMLTVVADSSLTDVAAYLQQCTCYLGNDSGITHLAAMLGVPTVAIFGPSDPTIWRPLGQVVRVLHQPVLEQLPADVVMEAINSFYRHRNIELDRTSGP